MSREAFQMIVAALIAGAIGFGIAISTVPLDEIVQFRALVNAGFGAFSKNNHLDRGSSGVKDTIRISPKASTERDSKSDGDSICDPNITNCKDASPTSTSIRSDVQNRDGTERVGLSDRTSSSPQVCIPMDGRGTLGPLTQNAGSQKAHAGQGRRSKRLANKRKR
jgi:hypothetical protein